MKFVGAGITEKLYELVPDLCGRLWRELDIVPLVRLYYNMVPCNSVAVS